MPSPIDFRPLNVTLRPQSPALDAYAQRAGVSSEAIAAGFQAQPELDLTYRGGRTISHLSFVNCYLGGAQAWEQSDRSSIDHALSGAMMDAHLQNVIAQYYSTPISSRALPSKLVDAAVGRRFFKDQAEATAVELFSQGVLGDADAADAVICLMLPKGVVLVDGNSDGSQQEAEHAREVLVHDEQGDSQAGLGGFHGSVHVQQTVVYYAIGVYSEGRNGIVAFDQPWKNIVATFYHELNEARTDPDVADTQRDGDARHLGWYSKEGGEIGDIPINVARDLSEVFAEVPLVGGGTVPIQLQWSNAVHAPEGPISAPH